MSEDETAPQPQESAPPPKEEKKEETRPEEGRVPVMPIIGVSTSALAAGGAGLYALGGPVAVLAGAGMLAAGGVMLASRRRPRRGSRFGRPARAGARPAGGGRSQVSRSAGVSARRPPAGSAANGRGVAQRAGGRSTGGRSPLTGVGGAGRSGLGTGRSPKAAPPLTGRPGGRSTAQPGRSPKPAQGATGGRSGGRSAGRSTPKTGERSPERSTGRRAQPPRTNNPTANNHRSPAQSGRRSPGAHRTAGPVRSAMRRAATRAAQRLDRSPSGRAILRGGRAARWAWKTRPAVAVRRGALAGLLWLVLRSGKAVRTGWMRLMVPGWKPDADAAPEIKEQVKTSPGVASGGDHMTGGEQMSTAANAVMEAAEDLKAALERLADVEGMVAYTQALEIIPHALRQVAVGVGRVSQRGEEEKPIDASVVEQVDGVAVMLNAVADESEEIPVTVRTAHAADFERLDTPRVNEDEWDAAANQS